jgi:flagellar biosynthesis protein FlhG
MRSSIRADQAEGLRRLLVQNYTRVVTVVSGKSGVGSSCVTLNLAAAISRLGKDVLVLDENHAPDNLLDHVGLDARFDLLDIAQGKCSALEAKLNACGFPVLPAARAMHCLASMTEAEQLHMQNALTEVSSGVDVMLIDTAKLAAPGTSKLANQVQLSSSLVHGVSLLVVVDATTTGITESYALIKRMALDNARLHFDIVVNKVGDEQAAKIVFANMSKVARRNLAARLEYLGYIPQDDKLKRASQLGKSVMEAFPASASAKSFLELSNRLLHFPIQQSGTEGGVHTIIKNLMRQVPQPISQRSKKVAHDVNY